MSMVTSLFEQAQLAEAAYANFSIAGVSTKDALQDVNNDGGFSATQATEFVTHWQVVSHIPNLNSGFSATVFESLDHPGEFSLAIRGSMPDQLGIDFKADAQLIISDGIAVTQVVDMYNYWQSLTHNGAYEAAKLTTQTVASDCLTSIYLSHAANDAFWKRSA